MKKLLLSLCLTGLISLHVQAQNMIAKFKYEEAEEAYAKNDYRTALSKVEEVEKLLKSSSPKTMYLKIISQQKLATTDFAILQNLRKNCGEYLSKYEGNENIEDKFREVYKISEALKEYPATEEAFHEMGKELDKKKAAEKAIVAANEADAAIAEKFRSFPPSLDGVTVGMERSAIPSSAWNYLSYKEPFDMPKGYMGIDRDCILYIPKFKTMKIKASEGLSGIYVEKATGKVAGVSKKHMVSGKGGTDEANATFENLVARMKKNFGEENVKITELQQQLTKKASAYTRTAALKDNSVSGYSIILHIITYGGVLGTECSVTEEFSIVKFKKQ
ncbi:hypothetical protein [Chitinophaga cymbidii]|uniref:Uncharacterized protein n=1 Tax=Chitinophaga cymbidii TaxID=1096750 RepID=A0A512RQD3_9BACT|nr:hypothetical protein [Chitinophaga cymbidii]GEP97902.1 hypothetical protein CCY01nite_41620 [Chitinophaga cymbidii]